MDRNIIDIAALILVIVGGLNWGLYAFGMNLVEMLLGTSVIATVVYVLVALAALYTITIVMEKAKK